MSQDEQFMRLALELGSRGGHKVLPNPQVGCVLVRDGKVIAEGWHDHIGGLHAEQMAIADAESREFLLKDPLHSSLSSHAITSAGPLPVQRPYYGLE